LLGRRRALTARSCERSIRGGRLRAGLNENPSSSGGSARSKIPTRARRRQRAGRGLDALATLLIARARAAPREPGSGPQERRSQVAVAEVTDQTFEAEILKSDKPAVVDFWAEWCGPCRAIAPIIKDLAERYGDRVQIAKVDVDANPAIAGKFGIRAIPTVLAFRNGQVVGQLQGARPRADFEAFVEKLLV
jgi:thioredoxin 1